MAGTKFSDYLGLNHYKKAKKLKHFIHLGLAQGPQSFVTYRSISPSGNLGNQLKNHVLECDGPKVSIFEIKMMVKIGVNFMPFSNPTCHFRATADFT